MVVLKLEMIPINHSYWRKRYEIARIVISKRLNSLRTDSIRSKQVGVSLVGEIMATSYVRAEQRTVLQFCYDSGMTPLDTLSKVKQDEYHWNVSQALVYKLFSRFREEKPADERMGKPPLRILAKARQLNQSSAKTEDKRCAT